MGINEVIAQLSPEAVAFIQSLVDAGDQQTLDLIVQIANEQGVQAVESAIQEFISQNPNMSSIRGQDAPQPPPVDPAMQGMPPAGAGAPPPPMPPDNTMAGLPPEAAAMLPQAAPMAMPPRDDGPPPPQRPQPTGEAGDKKEKKKKVPKYNPPPVPEVEKPTLQQILDDARDGREYWRPRDERIREDYDLYHLTYDNALFGDRDATIVGGVVIHKRTQPNTLVNLITSLATAKNDKLTTTMDPRSDGDEYEDASQDAEDFVLYAREQDEERWLETQVGEMPLPRKEAGLAALEGGFGWTWFIDPDNEEHPLQYELVPLSQLYDVGHACTRQYTLTLNKARRLHKKIREAYPLGDGKTWDGNQLVRIIVHMDNSGVYKSIVWEDLAGATRSTGKPLLGGSGGTLATTTDDEDKQWIQKPTKVNFGFRGFSSMVWGGSPAEMLQESENRGLVKFKGYGVLTMLRKTFRLMDLFISAVATGALRAVDPAWAIYTDEANKSKVPRPDTRPNAVTRYNKDDKVEPLQFAVSSNADSQNLMNSLIAELQEIQSPALSGGMGPSGVAAQFSTDQAAQQTVTPIIDAMEKWYSLMHKQRLILALRYSIDEKYNKDDSGESLTYFDKFPKKSYKEETWGSYGELDPKDIQKSGVRVLVRYHDKNLQEEIGLAQMVTQLTGAHLMSQETALRRMGVKDPKAELQRIFTDGAFMEKTVLKALVETAVYNSGNEQLIAAWDKAFYADMVSGQQGSQPAQPGMASQAGVQSTPTSAMTDPMAQQAGMPPQGMM